MRPLLLMSLACALGLAVACDRAPVSPGDSVFSSGRRIGSLSGGSEVCPAAFTGDINIVTKDNGLNASAVVWCNGTDASDTRTFSLGQVTNVSGSGRFASGIIDGGFKPTSATFHVEVIATNSQIYGDTATGTPAFTETQDTSCPSGKRLSASVDLQLQNLGPTTVSTSHCLPTP